MKEIWKNLKEYPNLGTRHQSKIKRIRENTNNEIKENLWIDKNTDNETTRYDTYNINKDISNNSYNIPEEPYYLINESELNIFKYLNKWYNEEIYIKMFWYPKNIITFWNWEILYTTNCLTKNDRKYVIWYIQKWNELKLRLFYKSKSEWARRACPWAREKWWYSKWEDIPNSSYETTTKISHEIECKFDSLPKENTNFDPIKEPADLCWYEILEMEMNNEINVEKLFNGYPNATCDSFYKKSTPEIIDMYKHLWKNFNLNNMQLLEWCWYAYEHHYLWTIEVEIWRLLHNWKYLDFYFAKAKNDPLNKVRIEEVSYPNAKFTSFWIYEKIINAAPLTWKPIEYTVRAPEDMKWNPKFPGSNYVDIRDLYQENPIIKWFKNKQKFIK